MRPLRSASMAALRFCGVTPAAFRILPASLSFSSASANSRRSTVTKAIARLLAGLFGRIENAGRARDRDKLALRRRPTLSAACRARLRPPARPARELPPERSIRPAANPSGSSSRTFSRCSVANCWWPSRRAKDCADCTKPRARSVYFSKFIVVLPRPMTAPDISGSPKAARPDIMWVRLLQFEEGNGLI